MRLAVGSGGRGRVTGGGIVVRRVPSRSAGRLPGSRPPAAAGSRAGLSEVERAVVHAALTGTLFEAAAAVPAQDDTGGLVSAEVIRDALAGGYGTLHHRGLRLRGVRAAEDLDLSYLSWRGALTLERTAA